MRPASKKPNKVLAGLPRERALLAPIITGFFDVLHVGASIHTAATARTFEEWHPLHNGPSTMLLEYEYGAQAHRWRYNERSIARAHREGKPVLGEHAGLSDFFVPVGALEGARTTLIVGPFATSRATSGDVLARWRGMTGSNGHFGDSRFSHYLTTTLALLTLEGRLVETFGRFLNCFARLLDPRSNVDALATNQVSWAVATKTKVYASSGRDNPHIWHATLANDAVWSDAGNPSGMTSGGSQTPGVLFDGEHHVLIVAQEMGGLWRYVEP